MSFNPVTKELVDALVDALGEHKVKQDPDILQSYQTDQEGDPRFHHMPELVVFPESTEEVAKVIRLANQYKVPITPRSGGTSVSRGAIPVYHGIVLVLTKMNHILKLDADNLYAVVETGVYTSDLQDAAKAGVTRDQIYAMKVVTPTGDIVTVGKRTKKNACGYALEQLMIGSEGTLGIITEITVKLLPLPKYRQDVVAVFRDNAKALRLPNRLTKEGIVATSMEYLDYKAIGAVAEYLDVTAPFAEEFCVYVIMTIETFNEAYMDEQLVTIDEVAREMGAEDVRIIEPKSTIWNLRRNFGEAAREASPKYYQEDFVVPLDKIIDVMEAIPTFEKKHDIPTITCAHIGDGNIHTALMNYGFDDDEWKEKVDAFHADVYPLVYSVGGSMSGEHGIGYKRVADFKKYTDPAEFKMMQAIKKALDPNDILNPGKIFDLEQE